MTTMIADPPRKTTMGVGFEANRFRTGDSQAWKKAIGTKPVAARLALLPDAKPRWDRIGVSAGVQLGIFAFLLILPLLFPQQMRTALNFRVTELMQPVTEIPVAPTPTAATKNQGQGCAARTKAGRARTCKAEPEADARLPCSQG